MTFIKTRLSTFILLNPKKPLTSTQWNDNETIRSIKYRSNKINFPINQGLVRTQCKPNA